MPAVGSLNSRRRLALAGALLVVGVGFAALGGSVGSALLVTSVSAAAIALAGRRGLLYLLVLTAPLEVYRAAVPELGINLSPFRIVLLFSAVDLVLQTIQTRRLPRPDVAIAGVGILVTLEVLTLYRALEPDLAARIVGHHLSGLAALVVISLGLRAENPRRLLTLFVASAALPVAIGLWTFLIQTPGSYPLPPGIGGLEVPPALHDTLREGTYSGSAISRDKGTFADPNQFAAFLVCALVIALGVATTRESDRNRRRTFQLAAVVLGFTLLTTVSKSGFISLLFAVPLLFGFTAPIRRLRRAAVRRTGAIALACAGACALTLALLPGEFTNRLDPFSATNRTSTSLHVETRTEALRWWTRYPVLGVGPGNFGPLFGQGALESNTHSVYTTVLAEMGVVGLAAFLATPVLFFRRRGIRAVLKDGSSRSPVRLLALAYLVLLVNSVMYEVWQSEFQWVLLGLALAAAAAPRRPPKDVNGDRPGRVEGAPLARA